MKKALSIIAIATSLLLLPLPGIAKPTPKQLDFKVRIKSISLNPTLMALLVVNVFPGSYAQQVGFVEGDNILQKDGKVIAGAKANDIKRLADKEDGQVTTFLIRRSNGEEKQITITAVPKH